VKPSLHQQSYATASIVTADRVVFNIKGNAYRLVAAVDFEKAIVWINGSDRIAITIEWT
jgi:mRNA-degrading endonuclease HigB of HigAB toxin-antitoxin module